MEEVVGVEGLAWAGEVGWKHDLMNQRIVGYRRRKPIATC